MKINSKTHTLIGLVVGVALVLAPEIFMFSDNEVGATVTRFIGAFIILSELITTSVISPLKLVPMRVHLWIDYLTGLLLAVSPWLFDFAQGTNSWLPHVIVGIVVIGYAAMTNPDTKSVEA